MNNGVCWKRSYQNHHAVETVKVDLVASQEESTDAGQIYLVERGIEYDHKDGVLRVGREGHNAAKVAASYLHIHIIDQSLPLVHFYGRISIGE